MGNDCKLWKKMSLVMLELICAIMLIGCGNAKVSEEQFNNDLRNDMIHFIYNGDERVLNYDDVEITLRNTEKKEKDEIFFNVKMSDDSFEVQASCYAEYKYYSEGGWVLDNFYFVDRPTSNSFLDFSEDAQMVSFTKPYAGSTLKDSSQDENYQSYLYEYKKDEKYCSYCGEVRICYDYVIDVDDNYIYATWNRMVFDPNIISMDWNVEGIWFCNNVKPSAYSQFPYAVAVSVNDFDGEIIKFTAVWETLKVSRDDQEVVFGMDEDLQPYFSFYIPHCLVEIHPSYANIIEDNGEPCRLTFKDGYDTSSQRTVDESVSQVIGYYTGGKVNWWSGFEQLTPSDLFETTLGNGFCQQFDDELVGKKIGDRISYENKYFSANRFVLLGVK